MPIRVCPTCEKGFKQKKDYEYHINRKFKCEKKPEEIVPKCIYCKKRFTTQSNLCRHEKEYCKEKDKYILANTEKLEKLFESQHNKQFNININNNNVINNTNNVQNNTQNVNINNPVVLVSYGKEDLSRIDPKIFRDALKQGLNSVTYLVKGIHFNENYPEYHNIYAPSSNGTHLFIYENGDWKLMEKKEILENLIDRNSYLLEEKYNDEFYRNRMSDDDIRRFEINIKCIDTKNKNYSYIVDNVILLLYNNRKKPLAHKMRQELVFKKEIKKLV